MANVIYLILKSSIHFYLLGKIKKEICDSSRFETTENNEVSLSYILGAIDQDLVCT